jgi:ribosomal subunit interface protein
MSFDASTQVEPLGAEVCCTTVMQVTVVRIRRGPYVEEPPIECPGSDVPGAVCNANPTPKAREVCVEIVVTGRNVEVPEHFREHIADKVARLERYDHKIVGMEVELFHEPNRRQSKSCQRVEITGRGCQGVARAEACAQDFYAALDCAVAKLESRLRRSHDRRRITGRRTRVTVGRGGGTAVLEDLETLVDIPGPRVHDENIPPGDQIPGKIVRHKTHTADPMSVDDALSRMELVGHDFYLFSDADTGEPSVVYRRKGYDYGVIQLVR